MPRGESPNSRKNLKPAWNREQAAECGKLSGIAKRKKKAEEKYSKAIMRNDINKTLGCIISVPPELLAGIKKLGIDIEPRERLSKLMMFNAMLKSFKKGELKPLLDLAEFAGMKEAMKVDLSGEVDSKLEISVSEA